MNLKRKNGKILEKIMKVIQGQIYKKRVKN